ncbi:protein of unknown function [Burkholderia multivorans]
MGIGSILSNEGAAARPPRRPMRSIVNRFRARGRVGRPDTTRRRHAAGAAQCTASVAHHDEMAFMTACQMKNPYSA